MDIVIYNELILNWTKWIYYACVVCAQILCIYEMWVTYALKTNSLREYIRVLQ